MKTNKKKLAKFPMGGVAKTPEQIQLEEYLARNNQTLDENKVYNQNREDNVTNSNKQLANADLYSQGTVATGLGVTQAIGGQTGKVGGVVGGIIGMANTIAQPIKARSEEVNQIQYDEQGKIIEDPNTGKLIDKKKAGRNAIIGSILSPSKALGYRIANKDWTGTGTDKYTDNLEAESTAQYEKALELQKQNQFYTDKANLDTYDLEGKEGVEYYNAKGGKLAKVPMYPDGGKIKTFGTPVPANYDYEGSKAKLNTGIPYPEMNNDDIIKYAHNKYDVGMLNYVDKKRVEEMINFLKKNPLPISYDIKNSKAATSNIFDKGGKLPSYPDGGRLPVRNNTTPQPLPFSMEQYYSTLNKYQTINPTNPKEANDVKSLVGKNIAPQLKTYQETLNKALRNKYKLASDAPITNQYLSPEEVNQYLGGKGEDYYKYFDAYQNYRKKTPQLPERNVEGTTTEDPKIYGRRHVNLFSSYAMGGELIPLASDVQLADGNTHDKGGITLTDNKNRPYAEIEDQEVIVGNSVYSDQLGYAKIAENLGKKKGKFERYLESSDIHKKEGAKRSIQKVDMQLNNLFNEQQMMKEKNGIDNNGTKKYANGDILPLMSAEDPEINPNLVAKYDENSFYNMATKDMQSGIPYEQGDFPVNEMKSSPTTFDSTGKPERAKLDYGKALDFGFNASRFVDNIYNANLTKKTPQTPRPRLEQASDLDTTINIDSALNENQNDLSNFGKNVDANLSSSNVGFAEKQQAIVNKIKANNQLFQNKFNTETGLRNQKKGENAQIAGRNLAKLDQYDMNKYNRELMLKGEKSANVANVVEDIGRIGTERSQKRLDDQTINNTLKLYSENDAAAYKGYDTFYDSAKSTGKLNDLKMIMAKSASGKEKWNKDPRNKNNQI